MEYEHSVFLKKVIGLGFIFAALVVCILIDPTTQALSCSVTYPSPALWIVIILYLLPTIIFILSANDVDHRWYAFGMGILCMAISHPIGGLIYRFFPSFAGDFLCTFTIISNYILHGILMLLVHRRGK